ncbi:MAG TPA: urea amidolyase, partial [Roseiflexaceae bacterium]|nr:urea amidolyase [Roseiflexaceae bacterium]
GGISVAEVLGSRSTCLAGGFGGFAGRPLRLGDVLEVGAASVDIWELAGQRWPAERRPAYRAEPILRVVRGPQADRFTVESLAALVSQSFRVSPTSNRMGYRLEGPLLHTIAPTDLPSLGVLPGAIQVPPDGGAILLMADAQTTGGYPMAGVVIGADLPLAAQLLPGDELRFVMVELEEAVDARRTVRAWLDAGPEPDEVRAWLGWAGALGTENFFVNCE